MKKKMVLLIIVISIIFVIGCISLVSFAAAAPSPEDAESGINSELISSQETSLSSIETSSVISEEVSSVVSEIESSEPIVEEVSSFVEVVEEPEVIVEEETEVVSLETVIEVPQGEYPAATQVWNIMKSYGWSDIVCAGIMGNMMRECGGDTLNLEWDLVYYGYYGLCQWSSTYHSGAWYLDIPGQCEFLKNSLDLSMFDGCTTPEEAAYVFCKRYERPAASDPVYKREANARRAYSYFTGQ